MTRSAKIGVRELKQRIHALLRQDDFEAALTALDQLPAREVINPLLYFFYNRDELVKWRAVTAVGAAVSRLAGTDMESARVVMRRLIWNLNDESGGIGWGAPEAMGEIMARHKGLAREYARILVSYARKDGNYIEIESLQRGVLWGLGRLARAFPELLKDTGVLFPPYLESTDGIVRGLAARLCGILRVDSARAFLENLKSDKTPIPLYCNGKICMDQVSRIAGDALSRMNPGVIYQ
ncbi:MAG: DVU0298 family protein [Thermodesulfobacteriota bacterium]